MKCHFFFHYNLLFFQFALCELFIIGLTTQEIILIISCSIDTFAVDGGFGAEHEVTPVK